MTTNLATTPEGKLPIMCLPGQPPAPRATAGEALSAISAGLDYLNAADVASLTTAEQAGCLRARRTTSAALPLTRRHHRSPRSRWVVLRDPRC